MPGKAGHAAFVDIRNIGGLTGDVNGKRSQQVCKLLHDSLGVLPDRVYLNFTEVEAANWGRNGSTVFDPFSAPFASPSRTPSGSPTVAIWSPLSQKRQKQRYILCSRKDC